ncbi:hypothetical protein [Plantibacter sp. RU18]|uniref:hypothetical protein n=1 Tax=Plantibacter sp. RU18 TaxID=3158143 RepID=UPI003D35F57D
MGEQSKLVVAITSGDRTTTHRVDELTIALPNGELFSLGLSARTWSELVALAPAREDDPAGHPVFVVRPGASNQLSLSIERVPGIDEQ